MKIVIKIEVDTISRNDLHTALQTLSFVFCHRAPTRDIPVGLTLNVIGPDDKIIGSMVVCE